MLRSLSTNAGLSAADFLRQVVRKQWGESNVAARHAKMERLALISLNEMAARPEVACAVAVVSDPGPRTSPLARSDDGPEPLASNILEAPMLGNIVTQGFDRSLTDKERALVEARFPGQSATWMFRSQ